MSADFPSECFGCPFQVGTFELTKDYVEKFSCQCGCLSNCSCYDNAKQYVDEVFYGEGGVIDD